MQLESIDSKLYKDIIGSFWSMLRELESQADNDDDRVLKHQVNGWYRQWNEMTGDNKSPIWQIREEK